MITTLPKTGNITPQVTISSRLADQMGALAQVYYLARWFDSLDANPRNKVGSGRSQFSLSHAATILEKSISTVRKNLYAAMRKGYFWYLTIKNDTVTLFYKSEARICGQMGFDDLGAIASINLSDLQSLRVTLTVCQAMAGQRKSKGAAYKENKIPLVDEEVIFGDEKNGCQHEGGQPYIIHQGPQLTYVSENFIPYGMSQATIAISLGRDERTIRRRLKDVRKTQLAVATDLPIENWQKVARQFMDMGDEVMAGEFARLCTWNGTTYRKGCNIYYSDITLHRQRHKRAKIKNFFDEKNVNSLFESNFPFLGMESA